jgi:hypothetical protein
LSFMSLTPMSILIVYSPSSITEDGVDVKPGAGYGREHDSLRPWPALYLIASTLNAIPRG